MAIAIIILGAIFIFLLRRHNKRLSILNETLYRNNLMLIEKEETTRKKFEDTSLHKIDTISPESNHKRYQNSDLTDAEKEDIYLSIMKVLLNSPEVFQPDFSSTRLSELTGYTYRHISQVINEKTGDNFNALVNNTRIKEACRRIQSEERFANLTLEAIARSVGFRSRTSFIAYFKKFTGLTPSVYQKMATKSKVNKQSDLQ